MSGCVCGGVPSLVLLGRVGWRVECDECRRATMWEADWERAEADWNEGRRG